MNKMRNKLLALTLAVMVMVVCTVTAQAAGTETWYWGCNEWNTMFITDYNITPVKTMGDGGTLTLVVGFESARNGVDEPTWYPPINLTVEVREAYTGKVLAKAVLPEDEFYEPRGMIVLEGLAKGTQLQLYFDISSQYDSPGVWRKGYVGYEACIE